MIKQTIGAMKTRFLVFSLLLLGFALQAQQDAQYTHYMYNTTNINPAYAGSRGVMSLFGLHRAQWLGLDGAPVTNAFSLNTPIRETNLGFGLSVVSDRIGPTNETTFSSDVSYTVPTSDRFSLSFGIKGTLNLFNLDVTKLNPANLGDPQFQDLNQVLTPNFGAGVYFHSDKTYVGFSIPNFFETRRYDDNSVSITKERMTYYFIGGHVFGITPVVDFKPAFLVKAIEGAPLQLDVSGNFLFYDRFVLGAAWRWNAAMSGLVGFQVSDQLFIGYSYDQETTRLANYNSGSHELFLRFELFNRVSKITSPRFF